MWRSWRPPRSSARWPIANVLYAVAFSLFPLRAILPQWLGVVGANVLIVAAAILCLEATREFRGLPPLLPAVYAAGGLTILVVSCFCYVFPSVNARIVAMSAFLGIVAVFCSATLLRKNPRRGKLGVAVASAVFALCAAAHFARGAYFIFAPPLSDLLTATLANIAFFTAATLSLVCSSIGWGVLTSQRLVMALEDAERRTIRTVRQLSEATERAASLERRAAAADVANSEVLALVNHEVRNPLGGVIAMADLLLDSNLPPEQQQCVLAMRADVATLLAVNDNLLDLSTLIARGLKLESSPFDLAALIEGVARTFAPIAQGRHLALSVEYPDRLPRRFVGDGPRIRQIVMNLVAQTLNATAEGRILIAAAFDDVDGTGHGVGVLVSSAPGSPLEFSVPDRDHLGIGIEVSRKLIELMGGRFGMQCPNDQGVSFRFTLPLQVA